jgi:hypothetical protein
MESLTNTWQLVKHILFKMLSRIETVCKVERIGVNEHERLYQTLVFYKILKGHDIRIITCK